jgi:hypothetical protein
LATVEDMVQAFARANRRDARLCVDLKIGGEEERIAALLDAAGVVDRAMIVSWLPSVIHAFHRLLPGTPLCFCHLSLAPVPLPFGWAAGMPHRAMLRIASFALRPFRRHLAKEIECVSLFFHADGDPRPDLCADRSRCFEGHVVPATVTGRMRVLLRESGGLVCLPRHCMTRALFEDYRAQQIRVAVYSINTRAALRTTLKSYVPDVVCVDDPDLVRDSLRELGSTQPD